MILSGALVAKVSRDEQSCFEYITEICSLRKWQQKMLIIAIATGTGFAYRISRLLRYGRVTTTLRIRFDEGASLIATCATPMVYNNGKSGPVGPPNNSRINASVTRPRAVSGR